MCRTPVTQSYDQKFWQSISGRAVKDRRPIILADVTRDLDNIYFDLAKHEVPCSFVSVPRLMREKAVGVIDSYMSVLDSFTTEEVLLMQTIAKQAAIAPLNIPPSSNRL